MMLKWLRLNYVIVLFALFAGLVFFLIFSATANGFYLKPAVITSKQIQKNVIIDKSVKSTESVVLKKQARSGFPVRIKIPKINVDTLVESVGLTPWGAVGVPKKPNNTAWYNLGQYPGANGNAVIVGHYGRWKNGIGSAFDKINLLAKGDVLYVKDERGTTTTFIVREIRKYKPTDIVADVFVSKDKKAHLNLITCEGVWDKVSKNYSNRLVVFTDKK